MSQIPYGYCHCGCGQKTNLATQTNKGRGNVIGEPVRYITGHNNRWQPNPRPAPVYNPDGTITIYLTRDQVTLIDKIDSDLTEYFWHARKRPSGMYDVSRSESKGHKQITLHRVIMERILNRPLQVDEEVDHRDCNPLNNTRGNLRVSTHSQNLANQSKKKTNTSGYKGVCYRKDRHKWTASIQVQNKPIHLGSFSSPEEAYETYKNAAIAYFGEFARFE